VSAFRQPGPLRASAALTVAPLSVAVPGRARLHVQGLRGRRGLADFIQERLPASPHIRSAHANPITGNVLVLYDEQRLSLRQVIGHIAKLGRRRDLDSAPSGRPVPPWAQPRQFHAMEISSVVEHLGVSPSSGLSPHEAAARMACVGPNRVRVMHSRPPWKVIADHLFSLPALMLAAAAALSLAMGSLLEAGVILSVVVLNATIGTVMEGWAERTIAALGALVTPHAIARRAGRDVTVDAADLVPGDVLVLAPGCQVSADARIIEVEQLVVNEATLTGESLPVEKYAETTRVAGASLVNRANMVYAGTEVAQGRGRAIVTATGRQTELGRIRALVDAPALRQSALARDLDRMGGRLVALSLGLSSVALVLGLLRGVSFLEMLRTAIALAVATVPEGLPTVTTAACALGMQRLRRDGVLVRELDIVERLGRVTVVCVDKTGTLTDGRMRVHEWRLGRRKAARSNWAPTAVLADRADAPTGPTDPLLRRALEIAVLCNEAELEPATGSPTELALLDAAEAAGLPYRSVRAKYPRLWIEYRTEGRNWMAIGHQTDDGARLVAVKGAPEEVLGLSTQLDDGRSLSTLTDAGRRDIACDNARMAAAGLRVLGLAWKAAVVEGPDGAARGGLAWVGLVGLADPIREGVGEALSACRRAGIRVVMLTGDQPLTAATVAQEAELCSRERPRVLDVSRQGAEDLDSLVRQVDVFARVSPSQKHQIVRALQQAGEVVAMAGDGINDAPALRAADIGIAVGIGGTAVARDVADVLLVDDNFASLLRAIAHGRTARANTKKAVRFLLSTNLSEIVFTLAAITGGIARPLTPIQFLWMNLLSDVLPALALAAEAPEPAVMEAPAARGDASVLSSTALHRIGVDGVVLSAGTLSSYAMALARHGIGSRSSSVAFTTLAAAQPLYALACRSESQPGWQGLGENPSMLAAIAATLGLDAAAVTIAPLRRVLGTSPLSGMDWAMVAAGAVLPALAMPLRALFHQTVGERPTANLR
jgi:Ca2+-transporting ATPase